jgi:predicted anti-sigma-YlaC factor YlaD
MNTNHLSAWEQDEYILTQGTDLQAPQMIRHLAECAECRAAVERLEHGVGIFRSAAVEWSSQCLATRAQQPYAVSVRRFPVVAMRWALAAIPLVLLALVLFSLHVPSPHAAQPLQQMSDDALLDQVDEQVSVAVPSSMESLTHLVSTQSSANAAAQGAKHIVQTN